MAITSADNLNSYGGSNVSPLASLDAPPCYPLWTLQKHPPWRLTANFLHSCFGGPVYKTEILGSFGLGLLRMALSKDKKIICLWKPTMPSHLSAVFLLTLKLLPKKNSVFRLSSQKSDNARHEQNAPERTSRKNLRFL